MGDPAADVARFRAYMAAFNARDYDALAGYYAEDIVLVIGNGTELRGRRAIVEFYAAVNGATTRTIEIVEALSDGILLSAELRSEFLAVADAPDFTSGPMRKGDRLAINSFAFYDLAGDRYARIRAATFRRNWMRASV
ncbi:nuclear transport factor 2 family protein [Sphingomonas baiyangensis]|uniref:Nuclear transport factor 2 family protein n=1 Tax=Sphingomonas baiyangensis TaxID=2572576 RepID=A0A4U1L447_9SPHN|nr:nuclear transport factor 2 family protein [Sphingomonas baiyangensis]TKD50906.1 nuclear transport factor 2 family protein [Sphingomonas baiyangensis]